MHSVWCCFTQSSESQLTVAREQLAKAKVSTMATQLKLLVPVINFISPKTPTCHESLYMKNRAKGNTIKNMKCFY